MPDYPPARRSRPAGSWRGSVDELRLDYDARFLRRKRLTCVSGTAVLVDLGETVSLSEGDALELEDGRLIAVTAAEEPLLAVHGDLLRLAWHIGNRHTPCQIAPDHLLIRRDPVLADMIARLGGHVHAVTAPFTPEGGAYGPGRTLGHDHGHHHGAGHTAGPAHDHGAPHHRHVHHHAGHGPDIPEAEDPGEEPPAR